MGSETDTETEAIKLLAANERKFVTKDSGVRDEFESGMVRDTEEGKARFDLLFPLGVPYADQFMVRVANRMTQGLAKYGERNWEKGNSPKELNRARSSAMRHLVQWLAGEGDEDHAAAVVFNLIQAETLMWKLGQAAPGQWDPILPLTEAEARTVYRP
ncbi:dATP/dGTP diphosphohydrolase domain-containing protein [Plantactinospora sp. WMMB782]|uniref:dATP/dGTP diphosphohydrolase domain-containing protein n=1 Tax=Plantactinospora sp. WMMB782 TaxID=3404121 RepID=UPI003B94EAC9